MSFYKKFLLIPTIISLSISSLSSDILPDPTSSKSNQPVILKSNNDALIVNIVTPNEKGISFNEYIKFNTPDSGTILNNSVNGANTLISGFIEANPFLNQGSASLIVNQINSNDPSLLRGNLEIAGSRADLLIANPSGISINGLNIINANSSTFTTSLVNLNNAFDIAKNLSTNYLGSNGEISIIDKGLNDHSNYTNIIANTINIASNIHANNLSLIADGNNNKNHIAIDSKELGGMYAGKINIIATSDGVGVNNKGIILANNIKISSSGDIINHNHIVANDIDIEAKDIINQSLSEIKTYKTSNHNTLDLRCCSTKSFALSISLKEIKEQIINQWKLENKSYSEDSLKDELYKRALSLDPTLYALDLHKNDYTQGGVRLLNNIKLDEANNLILVSISDDKDNEERRSLTYNLTKEYISDESLANFKPAQILATNDIKLKADTILNEKSYIYAEHDIDISSTTTENIGVNLLRESSSYNTHEWREKQKWYKNGSLKTKWVSKGGNGTTINRHFYEDGLPAIIASNNNFYANLTTFKNSANKGLDSIQTPTFLANNIGYIKFNPINTGFLYSLNGSSMAYTIGRFDELYKNANLLVNSSYDNLKHTGSISSGSLLIASNNIKIDASGDIYNSGTFSADNIELNSHNYTSKDENLLSKNTTITANKSIEITNSNANSNNLSLKAESIYIKGSNLNSKNDINLIADKNIDIDTIQDVIAVDVSGKDSRLRGVISTNQISNLNANNINLSSKDISLISANLDAKESININANNNIFIASRNDRTSLQSEVRSKSFLSKKQTITNIIDESAISSNLKANNIRLSSNNKVDISASNLIANKDIDIKSSDISIMPTQFNKLYSTYSSKSSLGGLKKGVDYSLDATTNLLSSNLLADSINLNANNSLNIASSNLIASDSINLNAQTLSLSALHELNTKEQLHKRSSFNLASMFKYASSLGATDATIYSSSSNQRANEKGIAKLSNIEANNININSNTATITGNLNAKNRLDIKADEAKILNASNTYKEYTLDKNIQIKTARIQDMLKDIKPKSLNELKKDTSLNFSIASASYYKATKNTNKSTAISSNLDAKHIDINANDDITIKGSNLNASDDIRLHSKNGNIYISNSTDSLDTNTALKEAKAILSLSVQNEYAQIAPAVIALKEAISQLKRVKKEYDSYKSQKSHLQTTLKDIKQRYKNKEIGIDYSDIEDITQILDEIRDEERYFIANIALATTNVASKTTALISQMAAASSSTGTYGFSAGINADISGIDTKSQTRQIISNPSNLSANNIKISTNKDKDTSTNITGSNLLATNDISIDTKDLNIKASSDTYEYNEKTKELGGDVSFTFYGGKGMLGLNYSQSHANNDSYSINNSLLYAKNNLDLTTSNDTTIKGGNLRADNELNLAVGNNLILESLRDKYNSSHNSIGIRAGIGFSGLTKAQSKDIQTKGLFDKNHIIDPSTLKQSSINSNLSLSRGSEISKQTILSSITADKLNINTKNNTHLKGFLIAAGEYKNIIDKEGSEDIKFIDNKNLNLTTNTLTYENSSNTRYAKGKSFAMNANLGINKKEIAKFAQDDFRPENMKNTLNIAKSEKANSLNDPNISNISLSASKSVNFGKTLATIGDGNLEIRNLDNSDDLDRLNRKVANIQKEITNSKVSTYAQADIDTRLFSQSGTEGIKHDLLLMTDMFSNNMPKENSTNPIEANIAKGLNFLGDITLGIIPSQSNNGGILGQIGAIMAADTNFAIIGDKNSKNVFIPGIMTDEYTEKYQAGLMFNSDNYQIYRNPTRGIIADLAESAVDFLGGTSGMAKQVGYEIKNNPYNNYIALSQGTILVNAGKKIYGFNDDNIIYIGTPLYRTFGKNTLNNPHDPVHAPHMILSPKTWEHGNPFYYKHVKEYREIIKSFKKENQ